jgi:hypothetical protein
MQNGTLVGKLPTGFLRIPSSSHFLQLQNDASFEWKPNFQNGGLNIQVRAQYDFELLHPTKLKRRWLVRRISVFVGFQKTRQPLGEEGVEECSNFPNSLRR